MRQLLKHNSISAGFTVFLLIALRLIFDFRSSVLGIISVMLYCFCLIYLTLSDIKEDLNARGIVRK